MRRLLVLILFLSTPAWAQLTQTEKLELKNIYLGSTHLDAAHTALGQLIQQTDVMFAATSSTQALLKLMQTRANSLQSKTFRALCYLEGVNPNPGLTTNTYILTGKTSGLAEIAPASITCASCPGGALKLNFDTIAADTNQGAAVRALGTTGSAEMVLYNAAINAVDTTLGYATPLPQTSSASTIKDFGSISTVDPTLENRPFTQGPSVAVIGPHGNYVGQLADLAFATSKMFTGLDDSSNSLKTAWDWVANGETIYSSAQFTAFGTVIIDAVAVLQRMRHNAVAFADIPTTDAECGLTSFHLVSDTMELLISKDVGLPFFYKDMADNAFDTLTEAMVTRPIARAKFSGSSSAVQTGVAWQNITMTTWRYSDGAVWGAFEFPIRRPFTLSELRAQFAESNTAHGATVCPDAINPAVSITNPTAASTISGMVNLSATGSDNILVNHVTFTIGAQQLGVPSTIAPFVVRWDSHEIANGSRTITATAYDAAGNTATSSATVTVSN